jgi:hypothetical protein
MHNQPLAPTDSLIGAKVQRLGELRAINKLTHDQAVDELVAYAGGALTRHGAELQLTAHRTAALRFAAVDPANAVTVTVPRNARDFARADLRFDLRRAA